MGTRLSRLAKAVLTSTHNLCFEQKYEKYQSCLSEHFPVLEGKFSIYLNTRVFVMLSVCQAPSENESTLKEKTLLPRGEIFFLLELTLFQKRGNFSCDSITSLYAIYHENMPI